MYYVKDLKTNEIHEFERCIDVTLFVEYPYRLQKLMFKEGWLIKNRYVLSLDLDFDKRKRIKPNEVIDLWIYENEEIRHEKTSLKEISERYDIPLKYVQMGKNRGRLLGNKIKIYTYAKEIKTRFK